MYYEINVSLNGRHLFATAERSVTSQFELEIVLPIFQEKFPANEGYGISYTKYENRGTMTRVQ